MCFTAVVSGYLCWCHFLGAVSLRFENRFMRNMVYVGIMEVLRLTPERQCLFYLEGKTGGGFGNFYGHEVFHVVYFTMIRLLRYVLLCFVFGAGSCLLIPCLRLLSYIDKISEHLSESP